MAPVWLPSLLVGVAISFATAHGAIPATAETSQAPAATVPADSAAELTPTSAVPWNPPRAIPAHEAWEEALNAPLTLVSLPFRALGAVAEASLLRVQNDRVVPRVQLVLASLPRRGITVQPANLGDRTGFGAAVDFAPPRLGGWLRAGLEGSTHRYNRGRVEFGPNQLAVSYVYDWRPQQPFFGVGPDARERDASSYAAQSQRAELRYQTRAGTRVRREVSAWLGERQSVVRHGRDARRPSFENVFAPLASGTLDAQQDHFVSGVRAALDTRGGQPHWSHGWRVAAQAERFARLESGHGVLFTGSDAAPEFDRITLEGQAGCSFMRDPRTLRLAVRIVDVEPTDGSPPPTVADLSRLGGSAGLAGFEPGRFHGLDLIVAKLGYYFPLAEFVELEVAAEAGAVSGDVWHATRLDRLEQSYSVMLRPRTRVAPLGAVGVSWSRETVRVGFTLGGVE